MPIHAAYRYAVHPGQDVRLTIRDDWGPNDGHTMAMWLDTGVWILVAPYEVMRPSVLLGPGETLIGRTLWINTVVRRRAGSADWKVVDSLTGGAQALDTTHDGPWANEPDVDCARRITFVAAPAAPAPVLA